MYVYLKMYVGVLTLISLYPLLDCIYTVLYTSIEYYLTYFLSQIQETQDTRTRRYKFYRKYLLALNPVREDKI